MNPLCCDDQNKRDAKQLQGITASDESYSFPQILLPPHPILFLRSKMMGCEEKQKGKRELQKPAL